MEDNKEKDVQNKPKVDIKFHEKLGIHEMYYSGSIMILTKDDCGKLFNQITANDKKITKLTTELDQAKKEIQRLKSELAISDKEKEKLEGKLESFTSHQGNGRPPILSNPHKDAIKAMYRQKMTVSEIHKALILKFGFKGNYETVRRYIRDSEASGSWQ